MSPESRFYSFSIIYMNILSSVVKNRRMGLLPFIHNVQHSTSLTETTYMYMYMYMYIYVYVPALHPLTTIFYNIYRSAMSVVLY